MSGARLLVEKEKPLRRSVSNLRIIIASCVYLASLSRLWQRKANYGIVQSAMPVSNLRQHFEEEKTKLNPEQRFAVESVEGPVMVLAGPGTGKTQVLAFRIAEILDRTDVSARNILALTFTESGVTAMRERLASLIGVTAYGVGIYTFHSFANRVINDSGAEFYKSHSLDPIDDIAQLKLIIELIDKAPDDRLRPLRAPYFYVKPILQALRSLKNEGVSPAQLEQLCANEIETLTKSDESLSKSGKTKGQLKQSVKDKIERLERTQALAGIYQAYSDELTSRGLYDYEDMILSVLQTFASNADLRARYQEQFQYILVDEYQDTNSAQNALVRLLCEGVESPNVFVVGDDKQSIYRFQGASMANLLTFRDWYPDAELVSLRQNYRSGQPILDNATKLIHHNQEQLVHALPELTDELTGQHTESRVAFFPYATSDSEVMGVVSAIKDLINKGVAPAQIAVIYRQNNEAADFADLLTRQKIAFHLEAGNDVLKDPDIRQLLNLFELAKDPGNEAAFFLFLHAPWSNIATVDLIRLGQWRKQERTTWQAMLAGDAPQAVVPLESWLILQQKKEQVENWYRYQLSHTIGDTAEFILTDSGFLPYLMEQPDHMDRLHRLRCFFDEIKHIMTAIHFATLGDLFERIALRQTYNLPLICLPVVERSNEAIRLMTAHKSKGLEFDYVFIPHFQDGLWSNSRKSELIHLPEGIVRHHKVSDEAQLEEDRRLFYVALTRAKKEVFISYAELDGAQRKVLPCQFLVELPEVTVETTKTVASITAADFFSPIESDFIAATSQSYLQELVTKQPITPTGLNTYLTCPMEYLYRNIYCIPGVRESFQSYGTAVHKAFELWGDWSKNNHGSFSLQSILSVFVETLVKSGLTESEVERFRKLGEDVLGAYYEQYNATWVSPLASEYSFTPHNVMLDNKIPITGKLDKVEPIAGSTLVRVIDYKTGRVKSRNEIEGKTASGDADYKRQLVFYTVLAESDPFFPYKIGEAQIAFIDDQKKFTTETFEITRQEKEELKQLIRDVYSEITALHFDHTPHAVAYGKGESLCDMLRETILSRRPHAIASPTTLENLSTST